MKRRKQIKSVSVDVRKIGIKDWLYSSIVPFGEIRYGILTDEDLADVKEIIEAGNCYIITYNETRNESSSRYNIIFRSFITDKQHVADLTWIQLHTNLCGCSYEKLKEYPDEINNIISDYVFGSKGDFTNKSKELQKYQKYEHIIDINYKDIKNYI